VSNLGEKVAYLNLQEVGSKFGFELPLAQKSVDVDLRSYGWGSGEAKGTTAKLPMLAKAEEWLSWFYDASEADALFVVGMRATTLEEEKLAVARVQQIASKILLRGAGPVVFAPTYGLLGKLAKALLEESPLGIPTQVRLPKSLSQWLLEYSLKKTGFDALAHLKESV
jgi:hypothetical protein